MQTDIVTVIHTPDEALNPCPFCGGRVVVVETSWDWGPYDLRHAKFRCKDCGGLFEYNWRPDPWKRIPHAIEWWNTRTPAPTRILQGYNVDELMAVADLLRENEVTPEMLKQICANIGEAVKMAERKFARDLDSQLQEYIERNG